MFIDNLSQEQIDRIRNWIAVLREREYIQGRINLRQGNTFCCLGVACDIAIKNNNIQGYWDCTTKNNKYFLIEPISKFLRYTVLPDNVQILYGLTHDQGKLSSKMSQDEKILKDINELSENDKCKVMHSLFLTTLNDVLKYSFEQIADVIEQELNWNLEANNNVYR